MSSHSHFMRPGTFQVRIEDTGESFVCSANFTVLRGMEALGRGGIPVGCRRGGCGVCKVEILAGAFDKRVMSRAHVSVEEEAAGCVLACRVFPRSDLRLRVLGTMKRCVLRGFGADAEKQS